MYRRILEFFLFLFLLSGCAVKPLPFKDTEVKKLSLMLQRMDKRIEPTEADRLSKDLFVQTARLTKEFELTSPPWLHNTLVNTGFRKKGLCYDWSDELYVHMVKQEAYPDFDFYLGGANIGRYWSEHNVLVITAKGKPFDTGIVIDPWRHSGKLYFAKVKEDVQYNWKERKDRCLTVFQNERRKDDR